MNVAALQKPAQHSKSCMHCAPAAVHATGRQSPLSHAPSQQSWVLAHAAPGAPHVAERQRFPAHCEPAQHSLVAVQPSPAAVHEPLPAAHRPETHCPLQHALWLEHSSPPGRQLHVALKHWPTQQSE